ncbi:hypothetical protein S83_071468 [Arachis hypogaea]|nr:uncharacterized protein DS421_20g707250 [Arachis hypogaea]
MDYFNIKVHHRGTFNNKEGVWQYLKDENTMVDWTNCDQLGTMEVYDMLEKLGYFEDNIAVLWYKDCGLSIDEGLRQFKTDVDAMAMANVGVEKGVADLFVMHKTSEPDDFPYEISYLDVGGGKTNEVMMLMWKWRPKMWTWRPKFLI